MKKKIEKVGINGPILWMAKDEGYRSELTGSKWNNQD